MQNHGTTRLLYHESYLLFSDYKYDKFQSLTNTKYAFRDMQHADLTGTNLTGANLTGANLTGANLTGANLTGANIQDVDL